MAELNKLLGGLFCQEVLTEERGIDIFIEFLHNILFINFIVYISIEIV
jgi:hypothetical protein